MSDEEKNTKFCSNCGQKIDMKAEICPKCGVRQLSSSSETKKDPGIAALLSFLWCGAGHIYLGQLNKGLILAIAYGSVWVLGLLTLVCLPLPILLWIYGIYDSYTLAKKLNQ